MGISATPSDVTSQLALDSNALTSLKAQAKTNPKLALSAAAGQFEALFMQMLLKSMREASPQDGPMDSEASKTYTAMFDQQISQQLAKKGIGIAAMLSKQLANTLPQDPAQAAATSAAGNIKAAKPVAAPATVAPAFVLPKRTVSAATSATTSAAATAATTTSSVAATVQAFVEKLRPYAEAAAEKLGVPVHYLIAQAGLETGWGKSQPKSADGTSSMNLFGIKATAAWKGTVAKATTTEYIAGQAAKTTAQFRSYGSYTDSFQDFAKLLQTSRRYANTLANTHDAGKYAASLQQAGYATDPRYAEKLTRAIQTVARYAPSTTIPATTQVAGSSADKTRDLA